MNSPLLKKLSKKKTGWRPKLVIDTETKKPRRNACMVSNGRRSKLVELQSEDLDNRQIDMALEMKVLEVIDDLEQADRDTMFRETIIFSSIASASINQAQYFVPLVRQEAKMKLKSFVGDTERFVNIIQKEAIEFNPELLEPLLDNLEDATHRTFQKFGDAIIHGKLPEFINMIEAFEAKPPEEKKPDPKPAAKKKGKLKVIK